MASILTWDEIPYETQEDLLEWYNIRPEDIDAEDKVLLSTLYNKGQFHAWNCPLCSERVYLGEPEDWAFFQGVQQVDYTSFPGDVRLCDDCRCAGYGQCDYECEVEQ